VRVFVARRRLVCMVARAQGAKGARAKSESARPLGATRATSVRDGVRDANASGSDRARRRIGRSVRVTACSRRCFMTCGERSDERLDRIVLLMASRWLRDIPCS